MKIIRFFQGWSIGRKMCRREKRSNRVEDVCKEVSMIRNYEIYESLGGK